MNRIELLGILVALVVGVIFVIKSKWFDRMIDSLMRGPKSASAEDLRADATRLNANTQTLQKDLDAKTAQIKRDRAALKNL